MFIYIILLPFFSFFTIFFLGNRLGSFGVMGLSCFNSFMAFLIASYYFIVNIKYGEVLFLETNLIWIDGFYLNVSWSFFLDLINCLLILLVTLVSFLVHVYSYSYMIKDVSFNRFISYLSLFTFFMLFLAVSTNFLQLFFGWEGVGLCSYLLINFWFTRVQANKAAIKAMLVNKVGDISLLIAIGLIFWVFHSLDFSVVFLLTPLVANEYLNFWFFEVTVLNCIAFFLFLAAIGKSAQLGLHVWLPDAMEGPTPVSALIHAATMVTAGIFLIIRCNVIFNYADIVLDLMVIVGSLTVFFGASVALFQYDIKKVIAFSTCSQLGYMMVACGLTRYDVSLYHLVNHGFFKALLFLAAGVVIHALGDEQDMRRMGGLVKLLPFTYTVFLFGSLSLIGFPFFSGFYSKDLILEACLLEGKAIYVFCYLLCIMGVFFTAAYSFRMIFLTFLVKPNGFRNSYIGLHDADGLMIFVLTVLCFLSIFSGFFSKEFFVAIGNNFWGSSIDYPRGKELLVNVEFLAFYVKLMPMLFMFLGMIASIVYHFNFSFKLAFYEKIFKSLKQFSFVYGFFNQKWFFDFLYNSFIVNFFVFFGYHIAYVRLDKGLLELVGPFGLYNFFLQLSDKLYFMQSGAIVLYVFYIFIIFSILLFIVLSPYTLINFDLCIVILIFLLVYENET